MHVNAFISICKDAKLVDEIMPVKRLRQIFLRAAEQVITRHLNRYASLE